METAPLEDIKGVITVRVSCNLMLPPNIKAKTEKLLYFLGISILPLMLLQHPCTIKLTRVIPICFLYYDRRKVVAHLKADTHTHAHTHPYVFPGAEHWPLASRQAGQKMKRLISQ